MINQIHYLFEDIVKRYANKPALSFDGRTISYDELNRRANTLARHLLANGLRCNGVVSILMDPSFEMIISVLAILKAGGCYLPINPDYPEEMILHILENSDCKLVVQNENSIVFQQDIPTVIVGHSTKSDDPSNLLLDLDGRNLAYIIYTSGTTGKPKGVMIEHNQLISLFQQQAFFDFSPDDIWSFFHSLNFDFSVWEIFGALLSGSTLVIVPPSIKNNPRKFYEFIHENKITILCQTPSAFYMLSGHSHIDKQLNLRKVYFGGESLQPIKLKNWSDKYKYIQFVNMYGITEGTIHVTYKDISKADIENNVNSIGDPLKNHHILLLDKANKIVNDNEIGEICLWGPGVSRGYVNNESENKKRFFMNEDYAHQSIYKTGDLGKRLSNGEYAYCGRLDNQIKVNGFRIELEAIENTLLGCSLLKDALVISEIYDGNPLIFTFVIMANNHEIAKAREYLTKKLPPYMIPHYFFKVDDIMLTSNGKKNKEFYKNICREYALTSSSDYIIRCMLGHDHECKPSDTLQQLGFTSITFVETIVKLEERLNIHFSNEKLDIHKFKNMQMLISYIKELIINHES